MSLLVSCYSISRERLLAGTFAWKSTKQCCLYFNLYARRHFGPWPCGPVYASWSWLIIKYVDGQCPITGIIIDGIIAFAAVCFFRSVSVSVCKVNCNSFSVFTAGTSDRYTTWLRSASPPCEECTSREPHLSTPKSDRPTSCVFSQSTMYLFTQIVSLLCGS